MKKTGLILSMLLFASVVHADVAIPIVLTDEEYKAMQVLKVTPEQWIQDAATWKAKKMIDRLVSPLSDKKIGKMTNAEKKVILDKIDIKKERKRRHGK